MNNILVATDFSENAAAAVNLGAHLAAITGARLILFHAYYPGILQADISIWADPGKLEEEVQQRMDLLARELHIKTGLSVIRLLKPGFAADEIMPVAEKINADLVVIGCRGAGNQQAEPMGKVARQLLKKAKLPLICIAPEARKNTEPTTIPGNFFGNKAGQELIEKLSINQSLFQS